MWLLRKFVIFPGIALRFFVPFRSCFYYIFFLFLFFFLLFGYLQSETLKKLMMTARTALATRAAARCPNLPHPCQRCIPTVPRCCLDLDFSNSHFDRLINFVDTETSGPCPAPSTLSVASKAAPFSLPLLLLHWLGNIGCPLFAAALRGLGSYPFILLPRSLSCTCSVSFSVCLSNWSLGFCVWKEALWFLICLSASARWILSIMWSPSHSLSLSVSLCALQFGDFLQSAIVLIVCLKLA